MKRPATAVLVTLALTSSPVMAQQCPDQLKRVDDALAKNTKLSPEQLAEALKYRATGERLLKEGKPAECMDAANKALLILTIG
jgi:hypothetical protein